MHRTGRAVTARPVSVSPVRCDARSALVALASLATGCGTSGPRFADDHDRPRERARRRRAFTSASSDRSTSSVRGAVLDRGPLDRVAGDRLVIVSSRASRGRGAVPAAAAAHPHDALRARRGVGRRAAPAEPRRRSCCGTTRPLASVESSPVSSSGRERDAPAGRVGRAGGAAARGRLPGASTDRLPRPVVLRQWSANRPARVQGSRSRGGRARRPVVMARGGLCAEAAFAGAHQQNDVGLRALATSSCPTVAAAQIVRDAVQGIYHGGEDLVFGAASGAIAVRSLDPRISPTIAVRARAAAQQLASGRSPTG